MTRRRLAIAVAAVLVCAAAGVITWQMLERPEPEPVPPAGMRYVGNDGVVFAVPKEWLALPPTPCLEPGRPFVTLEASWTAFCPAITEPLPPHVVIDRGWDGSSLQGLEVVGLVPSLLTLPEGWTTVPWVETVGSFVPGLDEMQQALDRAGLKHRVTSVYSKKMLDGTLVTTDPAMGSVIEEGGTVTLTVTTIDGAPTAGASSTP